MPCAASLQVRSMTDNFSGREFREDVLSRATRLLWPPHPDLHAAKRIAAERSMY